MHSSFLLSLCPSKFSIRTDLLIKFDMIDKINEKVKWLIKIILPNIDTEKKVNSFLEECLEECQPKFTEKSVSLFSLFLDTIKENTKTKKIDVLNGICIYTDWMISNGTFIIPFGEVKGVFNSSNKKELISLKNGPSIVHGNFYCYNCNINSLKYSPKIVEGNFSINDNIKLTSLKYGPEQVNGNYCCINCNLISLKGSPKQIFGNFTCRRNNLSSLENGPDEIHGTYDCSQNKLTTLKGVPDIIDETFICSDNHILKSLKNGPEKVYGDYLCEFCNILTLKDCNLKLKGHFDCIGNNLNFEEIDKFRKDIHF